MSAEALVAGAPRPSAKSEGSKADDAKRGDAGTISGDNSGSARSDDSEQFRLKLLHLLIDRGESWRERAVVRLSPLNATHIRRFASYQCRISEDLVLEAAERKEPPTEPWTQIVPLVRLPKAVLREFSARNMDGTPLTLLNRNDGANLSGNFLLRHFQQVCDAANVRVTPEDLVWITLYLNLVAFATPIESVRRMERCNIPSDCLINTEISHNKLISTLGPWMFGEVEGYISDSNFFLDEEAYDSFALLLSDLQRYAVAQAKSGLFGPTSTPLRDTVRNPLILFRDYLKFMSRDPKTRLETLSQATIRFTQFARSVMSLHTNLLQIYAEQVRTSSKASNEIARDIEGLFREILLFNHGYIVYSEIKVQAASRFLVKLEWTDALVRDPRSSVADVLTARSIHR